MNLSLKLLPAARFAVRGFTLIELMIAMLLGLVVIAGVSSIFLANQQTYRSNEALSEVQDGARVAFELLARDIRVAGLSGCNSTNGRVANVLNPSATNWFADWGNALHGYDDASTDPALSGLTGNGAPVASTSSNPSNSVHILSTQPIDAVLQDNKGGDPASFKITAPTTDLTTGGGDVVVICDYDHATIVQTTNYNGNITVVHNSGNSVSPGNCTKDLNYYPNLPGGADCNSHGPIPQFPGGANIAKLSGHVWYIGVNSQASSGKSLYRLNAVSSATGITVTPQEMVRNVTSMQIKYLQPPSATKFDIATNMTNWATVDSAQVTLTLQSSFQRAGTDSKPLMRKFTTTATVRNRVN